MRRKWASVLSTLLLLLTAASGEVVAQKKKFKEKRYEPATRPALKDYEGRYIGVEDSYYIEVRVTPDGGLTITSFEDERQAVLKGIRLEGAIITATKVYTDGEIESFAGVFANRILNGQSAFGIIVDNMQVSVAGLTLTGLFYRLREESTAGIVPVIETNASLVRREIEMLYAQMSAAVENKDFGSLQALRADNFLARLPGGEILDKEQMAARSRALLERIQLPIKLSSSIETLILMDNEAIAVIHQNFSSMQEVSGRLCLIETGATQRETWTRTHEGWKLKFVDNIRDQQTLVDGQPQDQTSLAGEPSFAAHEL